MAIAALTRNLFNIIAVLSLLEMNNRARATHKLNHTSCAIGQLPTRRNTACSRPRPVSPKHAEEYRNFLCTTYLLPVEPDDLQVARPDDPLHGLVIATGARLRQHPRDFRVSARVGRRCKQGHEIWQGVLVVRLVAPVASGGVRTGCKNVKFLSATAFASAQLFD